MTVESAKAIARIAKIFFIVLNFPQPHSYAARTGQGAL